MIDKFLFASVTGNGSSDFVSNEERGLTSVRRRCLCDSVLDRLSTIREALRCLDETDRTIRVRCWSPGDGSTAQSIRSDEVSFSRVEFLFAGLTTRSQAVWCPLDVVSNVSWRLLSCLDIRRPPVLPRRSPPPRRNLGRSLCCRAPPTPPRPLVDHRPRSCMGTSRQDPPRHRSCPCWRSTSSSLPRSLLRIDQQHGAVQSLRPHGRRQRISSQRPRDVRIVPDARWRSTVAPRIRWDGWDG